MKYNKLVRDNIPDIIVSKGDHATTHIANDKEYWEKLKEKLVEEVEEFAKDESIAEIADILEVITAIIAYKRFDPVELSEIKRKKKEERGGFEKRIILEES